MKLLIVDPKGGEFGQIEVYRSMAAGEGLEVTLLLPRQSFDGFTTAPPPEERSDSLKVVSGMALLPNRSHRSILPKLWSLLRRERFDILYAEAEPESYQGLHAVVGWGLLSQATKLVLMSWRNIDFPPGTYPFRAAWTHACAEKLTLPRIDGIVVHNQDALKIFKAKGVQEIARIPPAVDTSRFRPDDPSESRPASRRFSIGYVGRFVSEKGIDILLKTSAFLPFDHEILLVGAGPHENNLRNLSRSLGITERVRWIGPVSYGLLPQIYLTMDVLVLPSRTTPLWKEQFGRVVIEAMACGVPVVGSSSGEIPATIGNTGLVFTEGEVQNLAAQLIRLQKDALLREDLGKRARERVVANFSVPKVAAMSREFFERVQGASAKTAEV